MSQLARWKCMHNAEGEQVWERSLDTFGKVKLGDNNSCPFMYQGQYLDDDLELCYNRFRYYDPEDGRYISQDPIGLNSGEFNLYSYVDDTNTWVDLFGLQGGGSYGKTRKANSGGETNHMPANSATQKSGTGITKYSGPSTHMTTADHQERYTSKQWRAHQEDLIRRGKYGKAMEMDIRDVKRKFGNKYNKGMGEMIDYATQKGYITGAEGRRMKRKHLSY